MDKQAIAKKIHGICLTKNLTIEVHTALNDTSITEIKLKHVTGIDTGSQPPDIMQQLLLGSKYSPTSQHNFYNCARAVH